MGSKGHRCNHLRNSLDRDLVQQLQKDQKTLLEQWYTVLLNENDYAITVSTTAMSATFKPASSNYQTLAGSWLSFTVSQLEVDVIPDGVSPFFGDEIPALSGTSDFLADDGIVASFDDYSN